jgi:DNA-binding SARP family transcriptional activator/class 3 adenylate cyclase
MPASITARIKLCGELVVELDGRRVEHDLPGRQGRLLVAYLATRRGRPVSRDELIAALWPRDLPADPEKSLAVLLSKVRSALPSGLVEGRQHLELVLPSGGSIDLEDAHAAAIRAEAALVDSDWRTGWAEAGAALEVVSRGFLAGYDAPWVQEQRRDVEELRLRALESAAAAGSALGGPELAGGERAARALIEAAPFRESGHRFLMVALAARGNVAEALQAYEGVRVRLRDELGAAPGAALQALHERLLTKGAGGPGGAPLVDPMAAPTEVAPPPSVREERRLVTVLFADLSAGQELDPESAQAMLAPHVARVRAELERFGGTIDRFVGGALLAVFGAPVAHEDDPERAVRAALGVVELVRALGRDAPELEPVARAGIATGEALVRLGAPASAGDALVQGGVVGAALRLLGSATADSVLVDHATVPRTGDLVEYRELEPLRSWAADGVRTSAPPAPTRFVGREHELALLEALKRTVTEEERPRLVAIVGEPGVGKTRLTDELVGHIAGSVAVYRGRCLPYGEGITYWALREILWAVAGIRLDDDREMAADKLGRLVARLLGDHDDARRTAAALARTASMALADSPLERMAPESVAEEIGLAWPRFLGALARERPTVVVVEDLHWAETPLLDMLERLVRRAAGRLLIVATARPEFADARPRWNATPGMSQIGLAPLTDAQSRELVRSLLPRAGDDLLARVVGPAEGNPFFAEELARQLAANTETEAIPHSVRALLAARIDALPEAEKQVLHHAAVVGRVFWATALDAMTAGVPLRASLESLEEKGLVVANPGSVLPGQREYSFRHALKREVAYRSIPRAQRCRAHAAVAGWIEDLAGDRRAEFAELIAYHYETAAAPLDAALAWPRDPVERERVRAAAVRALVTAGDQARARLALDHALRFADRALELAASDAERLATLELRASALHAAVRCDEAFAAYRTGLELAKRLGGRRRAAVRPLPGRLHRRLVEATRRRADRARARGARRAGGHVRGRRAARRALGDERRLVRRAHG